MSCEKDFAFAASKGRFSADLFLGVFFDTNRANLPTIQQHQEEIVCYLVCCFGMFSLECGFSSASFVGASCR